METIEPTRARPTVRPRISVVVPAYNYARFLTECVRSVLAQEDVDLDVLIIDDASSDDTPEVALELARRDERVRVVLHEQNKGHIDTFNEGLFAAEGEYVVLLDADDLLPPGSLARATALLEARPDIGFVSGWPVSFSGPAPDLPIGEIKSWTIWSGHDWDAARCQSGYNCISTPEVVMRTSVMRATGGMKASLPHTADFELWMQLAARSNVGRVNGPPQGYYRIHSGSMLRSSFAESDIDLAQRRDAFTSLFQGPAGDWPDAEVLHDTARRQLADHALGRASRAYERGRTEDVAVDELIRFAFEVCPNAQQLPEWRALTRRRRVGPHAAKVMPPFLARAAARRASDEMKIRRWKRTGVL
jgi:glycosyltransferase involved in cell wall biosynthesis